MNEGEGKGPLRRALRRFVRIQDVVLGTLVIILMLGIVAQVVLSALDVNPIAEFEEAHFLVGRAITLNSFLDFQWHLLVVIGLIPAGIVWLREGHVRVDFIYSAFSERTKGIVNLVGHAIFAAPFLIMIIPATWDFAHRAYRSGEAGTSGGLTDLWVIKGVLFVGLCGLAFAVAIETVKLVRKVF